jgi:hypothetical protein
MPSLKWTRQNPNQLSDNEISAQKEQTLCNLLTQNQPLGRRPKQQNLNLESEIIRTRNFRVEQREKGKGLLRPKMCSAHQDRFESVRRIQPSLLAEGQSYNFTQLTLNPSSKLRPPPISSTIHREVLSTWHEKGKFLLIHSGAVLARGGISSSPSLQSTFALM